MDDGRVTLNAGGRVFETTALTLKTSGAGYFEALLGETGARLPGSKKRARVSEDGDDAPGQQPSGEAEERHLVPRALDQDLERDQDEDHRQRLRVRRSGQRA